MIDFGLRAEEFAREYLDRESYLRRSVLSTIPLDWADLERALSFAETDAATLQMFQNGEIAPQAFIDEGMKFGRSVTLTTPSCCNWLARSTSRCSRPVGNCP